MPLVCPGNERCNCRASPAQCEALSSAGEAARSEVCRDLQRDVFNCPQFSSESLNHRSFLFYSPSWHHSPVVSPATTGCFSITRVPLPSPKTAKLLMLILGPWEGLFLLSVGTNWCQPASGTPKDTALLKGKKCDVLQSWELFKENIQQSVLSELYIMYSVLGRIRGEWHTSKIGFFVTNCWQVCNCTSATTGRAFCVSDTWVQGCPLDVKGLGNLKGIQILVKYNYWDTSLRWCIYLTNSHVCFLVPLLQAVQYSLCG